MWLEYINDAFVGEEILDRFKVGGYFLGMVSIIVNAIIKAVTNDGKGLQPLSEFCFCKSASERHNSGSHCVFYIVETGVCECNIIEHFVGSAQVKKDISTVITHINGIVVGGDTARRVGESVYIFGERHIIVVAFQTVDGSLQRFAATGFATISTIMRGAIVVGAGTSRGLNMFIFIVMMTCAAKALFHKEFPLGICLPGKLAKSLKQIGISAINIKMVGVGGSDDAKIRIQLQERTVVFIGLYHNIFTLIVDHHITAKILGYSAQESATT